MRKTVGWGLAPWLLGLALLLMPCGASAAPSTETSAPAATGREAGSLLEDVLFERLAGRERIVLVMSGPAGVAIDRPEGRALLVKIDQADLPERLGRTLGEGRLVNVVRVRPRQGSGQGKRWVELAVDLREMVPYSGRHQGNNIVIEFHLPAAAEGGRPPEALVRPPGAQTAGPPVRPAGLPEPPFFAQAAPETRPSPPLPEKTEPARCTDRLIDLNFQGTEIRAVFELLAEQCDVDRISIVAGDGVAGELSLNLKRVAWDRALDTILEIKDLVKSQSGTVITVLTRANRDKIREQQAKARVEELKLKMVESQVTRIVPIKYADAKGLQENVQELLKDPADKEGKLTRGSVRVDQHNSALIIQASPEDAARLIPIIEKIDKATPQVKIRAHIVETTKNTARDLGVQWGGVYGARTGSGQNLFLTPGGAGGSAKPPGSVLDGSYKPTAGPGIAGQGYNVNFPATTLTGTASASLGLIFGSIGGNLLEMQLTALQKDGKLRILSSPSLTTMHNQEAITEDGRKVPYVTTETSGGVVSRAVKFEKVTLQLKVKPVVIDGKTMRMEIYVEKSELHPTDKVEGNPVILTKRTETKLIVQDGETIVISGLTKQTLSESDAGVPWFKDIPVLGWLFKEQGKSDAMDEVLIFMTPTIVKPEVVAGIQEGAEPKAAPPAASAK